MITDTLMVNDCPPTTVRSLSIESTVGDEAAYRRMSGGSA